MWPWTLWQKVSLLFYKNVIVLCYLVINTLELPVPMCVVEERSKVKAVVIRTVALSMVGRSNCGHLVAVHRVHPEEVLHLLGHLHKQAAVCPEHRGAKLMQNAFQQLVGLKKP